MFSLMDAEKIYEKYSRERITGDYATQGSAIWCNLSFARKDATKFQRGFFLELAPQNTDPQTYYANLRRGFDKPDQGLNEEKLTEIRTLIRKEILPQLNSTGVFMSFWSEIRSNIESVFPYFSNFMSSCSLREKKSRGMTLAVGRDKFLDEFVILYNPDFLLELAIVDFFTGSSYAYDVEDARRFLSQIYVYISTFCFLHEMMHVLSDHFNSELEKKVGPQNINLYGDFFINVYVGSLLEGTVGASSAHRIPIIGIKDLRFSGEINWDVIKAKYMSRDGKFYPVKFITDHFIGATSIPGNVASYFQSEQVVLWGELSSWAPDETVFATLIIQMTPMCIREIFLNDSHKIIESFDNLTKVLFSKGKMAVKAPEPPQPPQDEPEDPDEEGDESGDAGDRSGGGDSQPPQQPQQPQPPQPPQQPPKKDPDKSSEESPDKPASGESGEQDQEDDGGTGDGEGTDSDESPDGEEDSASDESPDNDSGNGEETDGSGDNEPSSGDEPPESPPKPKEGPTQEKPPEDKSDKGPNSDTGDEGEPDDDEGPGESGGGGEEGDDPGESGDEEGDGSGDGSNDGEEDGEGDTGDGDFGNDGGESGDDDAPGGDDSGDGEEPDDGDMGDPGKPQSGKGKPPSQPPKSSNPPPESGDESGDASGDESGDESGDGGSPSPQPQRQPPVAPPQNTPSQDDEGDGEEGDEGDGEEGDTLPPDAKTRQPAQAGNSAGKPPKTDLEKVIEEMEKELQKGASEETPEPDPETEDPGIDNLNPQENGVDDKLKGDIKKSIEAASKAGDTVKNMSPEQVAKVNDMFKGTGLSRFGNRPNPEKPWKQVLAKLMQDGMGWDIKDDLDAPHARIEGEFGREVDIPAVKKVALLFDISGSMQWPQYEVILSQMEEILKINKMNRVDFHVFMWGTQEVMYFLYKGVSGLVPRIYTVFKQSLGGGTAGHYLPMMVANRVKRPDIILCFTDGEVYGRFSNESASVFHRFKRKWIWCLVKSATTVSGIKGFDPSCEERLVRVK